MDTPINALLILCDEPELQLFPEQQMSWEMKDHENDCELGQEGVSALVVLQSLPWAPHLL